eukprot:TRINITY_DN7990_c0_g1_i1.p1 TRINITY_DN7990_c0_g1~~TRINITY_DN7990_c0_g1_i1.p1  ORF type:complete len:279 (-),score=46.90 TRINITY_DN7990_c0_g1_i1:615-1451(-)
MAAVAGVPRVPTRAGQAAGTVIGAARVIEQSFPNVRMSVFASGVNRNGDIRWMILHGSGMDENPEILPLEGQLQHARRSLEGLVMAGAAMDFPPAASVGDSVPVGDAHVVLPFDVTVPDATVTRTPRLGDVPRTAPLVGSAPAAPVSATPSGAAGASSSRASPSNAAYTFTEDELDEILGHPRVSALMHSQSAAGDARRSSSPELVEAGDADSLVRDVPPADDAPPLCGTLATWGVEPDGGDVDKDYYFVPVDGGINIDAAYGLVNVQPGIGAPPPLL